MESYLESMLENDTNFGGSSNSLHRQNMFENRSLHNYGVTKPALTDSYLIDDEIHMIIDLIMRDYIDIWYKNAVIKITSFSFSMYSVSWGGGGGGVG